VGLIKTPKLFEQQSADYKRDDYDDNGAIQEKTITVQKRKSKN
jgi:hypothetical protein